MRKLRVGFDLDDTINVWMDIYLNRFGNPNNDFEITYNVFNILRKDKEFWLNLPVKHLPDFQPELFCTARVIPKSWTKKWLRNHGLSTKPVYQRWGYCASKAPLIKGRCDVFIEDSIKNFKDLNSKGIPCLLIDSPYNREFKTSLRIYSLNYSEIETTYIKGFGILN